MRSIIIHHNSTNILEDIANVFRKYDFIGVSTNSANNMISANKELGSNAMGSVAIKVKDADNKTAKIEMMVFMDDDFNEFPFTYDEILGNDILNLIKRDFTITILRPDGFPPDIK